MEEMVVCSRLSMLIDIDGDGLPDIVKRNDDISYYPARLNTAGGMFGDNIYFRRIL